MGNWQDLVDETLLFGTLAALAGWCVLCLSVANFGSWNRVARRYPAPGAPCGQRFWLRSVQLGRSYYPGCVTVHVSEDGIHLSVTTVFRLGHPPIFLPASAIHHYRTSRRLFIRHSIFDIGWPRVCTVRLRRKTMLALEGRAIGSGEYLMAREVETIRQPHRA